MVLVEQAHEAGYTAGPWLGGRLNTPPLRQLGLVRCRRGARPIWTGNLAVQLCSLEIIQPPGVSVSRNWG